MPWAPPRFAVKNDNVNCYAENAFNEISDSITLVPIKYSEEFCGEVDTKDDLVIAEEWAKGLKI